MYDIVFVCKLGAMHHFKLTGYPSAFKPTLRMSNPTVSYGLETGRYHLFEIDTISIFS